MRWHSRVPVVDPARLTEELASTLAPIGKSTWLAVHANHPREVTDAARLALRRLSEAGVNLVSQSVLLRGVNDVNRAYGSEQTGRVGLLPGVVLTVQSATQIVLSPISAVANAGIR